MKKINSELLKGSTEMMILKLLASGDLYGYELVKKLAAISQGLFCMGQGSLYPILHFLEEEEYIVSYWEDTVSKRKRKYYRLTQKGKGLLEERIREWNLFVGGVNRVLEEN